MKRLLLAGFVGFAAVTASADSISGEVFYLPKIALPPTAQLTVSIVDVSKADAPSQTIAELVADTRGLQVPIPFTLFFSRTQLQSGHRYNVQAQITDKGKLLFVTTTALPLPAGDASMRIQVDQVKAVAPEPAGTTFFATEIDGVKLNNYPGTRRVTLRLDETGRTFGGFAGVNTYGGSFTRDGHGIKFGPARATMMAGDAGSMKIEQSLFKALNQATSAKYFGTFLVLYKNGAVIFKGYSNLSE